MDLFTLFRLEDWENALPHIWQIWGRWFSWTCKMWIRSRSRFSKDLFWGNIPIPPILAQFTLGKGHRESVEGHCPHMEWIWGVYPFGLANLYIFLAFPTLTDNIHSWTLSRIDGNWILGHNPHSPLFGRIPLKLVQNWLKNMSSKMFPISCLQPADFSFLPILEASITNSSPFAILRIIFPVLAQKFASARFVVLWQNFRRFDGTWGRKRRKKRFFDWTSIRVPGKSGEGPSKRRAWKGVEEEVPLDWIVLEEDWPTESGLIVQRRKGHCWRWLPDSNLWEIIMKKWLNCLLLILNLKNFLIHQLKQEVGRRF